MHLTTIARRRLLACLAGVAGIVGSGSAVAQQPTPPASGGVVAKIDPKTNAVLVPLGGYGRFDPGTGKLIKNIEVSNSDVLVVRPGLPSRSPQSRLETVQIEALQEGFGRKNLRAVRQQWLVRQWAHLHDTHWRR